MPQIPFNLEKAKAGYRLTTRNGFPATLVKDDVVHTDPLTNQELPLLILVHKTYTQQSPMLYPLSGLYVDPQGIHYPMMDLVMEQQCEYVNLYRNTEGGISCGNLFTEDQCMQENITGFIGTVCIADGKIVNGQ